MGAILLDSFSKKQLVILSVVGGASILLGILLGRLFFCRFIFVNIISPFPFNPFPHYLLPYVVCIMLHVLHCAAVVSSACSTHTCPHRRVRPGSRSQRPADCVRVQ